MLMKMDLNMYYIYYSFVINYIYNKIYANTILILKKKKKIIKKMYN